MAAIPGNPIEIDYFEWLFRSVASGTKIAKVNRLKDDLNHRLTFIELRNICEYAFIRRIGFGPRPPLPVEVELYKMWQRRRLSLKPGLTCIWQVSGRNQIQFERWMEMDLEYIDRWSLWLDSKILFRTIFVVLFGYGAS